LSDANRGLVAQKFLLEPQFRQPVRGQRLDIADRNEIADELAADISRRVDPGLVRVEAQALPANQLLEIGGDIGLEPVLINRAAPYSARRVAEHLSLVDKSVIDALFAQPFANAVGIALVRQAGCDRRRRDAAPPFLGLVRPRC